MTTKTTINWWDQASELNDHQSENLNGGRYDQSVSVEYGPLHVNFGDRKHFTIKSPKYIGHHNPHVHFFSTHRPIILN
jgi:hypothetical protein